jgi:tRNA(Arg) A34 adenosine deaminase TadA
MLDVEKYAGKKAYQILVVRINSEGMLSDSKPCSMCINLMKAYGIKRVYYSDIDGNICFMKLNQIDCDNYFSQGLIVMIRQTSDIKTKKLPLTKSQKTYLIENLLKKN